MYFKLPIRNSDDKDNTCMEHAYRAGMQSPYKDYYSTGAIIVKGSHILADGKFKVSPGFHPTLQDLMGGKYDAYQIHPAFVAIAAACSQGKSVENTVIYSPLLPDCVNATFIAVHGIKEFVYDNNAMSRICRKEDLERTFKISANILKTGGVLLKGINPIHREDFNFMGVTYKI